MIQKLKPAALSTLFLCFIFLLQGCGPTQEIRIDPGQGMFLFDGYEPLSDKPVRVFTYRPEGDVSEMPILFVLHGTLRNADTYRDNWIDISEEHGVLIVTPEFNSDDFPGARGFNLGGMFDEDGNQTGERYWAYSLIEPIFDEVVARVNGSQESYDIFGHSAGAQFTHRLLLFKENLRANHVISSNAGWYTTPDFETEFPYGMKDTALDTDRLQERFSATLLIQLGEEDTDPEDRHLRTTENAMIQGMHRFERGHNFFDMAAAKAAELGSEFNWLIRTVPGVGHENALMAIDAAEYLYGSE
jgi:hypothetical protein